jgi:hypothetical protein
MAGAKSGSLRNPAAKDKLGMQDDSMARSKGEDTVGPCPCLPARRHLSQHQPNLFDQVGEGRACSRLSSSIAEGFTLSQNLPQFRCISRGDPLLRHFKWKGSLNKVKMNAGRPSARRVNNGMQILHETSDGMGYRNGNTRSVSSWSSSRWKKIISP